MSAKYYSLTIIKYDNNNKPTTSEMVVIKNFTSLEYYLKNYLGFSDEMRKDFYFASDNYHPYTHRETWYELDEIDIFNVETEYEN